MLQRQLRPLLSPARAPQRPLRFAPSLTATRFSSSSSPRPDARPRPPLSKKEFEELFEEMWEAMRFPERVGGLAGALAPFFQQCISVHFFHLGWVSPLATIGDFLLVTVVGWIYGATIGWTAGQWRFWRERPGKLGPFVVAFWRDLRDISGSKKT